MVWILGYKTFFIAEVFMSNKVVVVLGGQSLLPVALRARYGINALNITSSFVQVMK
jgi:hypothetical protein